MARAGPLREVWRRGVAMSEVMEGSGLTLVPVLGPPLQILPQQHSSASTSCSTILSSHCQPCQRVRQRSSHAIMSIPRHQRQWMLLLDNKQPNGSFGVKHFPSSFHGHARALKHQRRCPNEKFKDAFNFSLTKEPKRTLDVQSFVTPFDESHRHQGNSPSTVTQLPTALEPQFPSASVDQSKTRDLNASGNLDQSISSSTLEVVQPGLKASLKPVLTVSTISEYRRLQRAPSPNNGRPGPRFETSYMLGIQPLPKSSNKIASSNSNPNSSKQTEDGVESKHVISNLTVWRSPEGGAHLLSSSHVAQVSYGKSGTRVELRVEPAGVVVDQARSSQNGAHPALNNYRIPASRIAHGRLQCRASYGSRDWSRDTAQGNGSSLMQCAGSTSAAIAILRNRLQRGVTIDSYTYVKVLQMCLKEKDLIAAKQVHKCIIQSGMDKNPYVATSLLNVYIRCGEFLDARRVFDELEKKDVITWTVMIAAYAKSDNAESALELFKLMRQDGARPNEVTYLGILKACASPLALKWGKQVHEYIRHAGFESDVRVGTALLQMYAKCGCITEARRIFENLSNRNIVTWNVMIGAYAESGHGVEAYRLFLEMRRKGFEPNAITFASILNASASAGSLEWVKEVHGEAREAGLESDLRVCNALVHLYSNSGSIDDALLVFDRMQKRDVITWNAMIGGLAQHGCGHEAYRLFLKMRREGFEPDAITYISILNAFASVGALEWVKEVHGQASKAGLESDLRVGNALVHMYSNSGSIHDALLVFDRMEKRDVITWNAMIGGLAQHGCGHEAYRLFLQMRREGFKPDAITYLSILKASASAGALEWVKEVHGHATKAGLESDLRVGNALVHMYAESGGIDYARRVFYRMQKRNVVTWNAMIGGLAQHRCGHEAYRLFLQMRRESFEPDAITYLSILNASASAGALEWVKEVHGHASKGGLESDLRVGNALVHMYAESGSIDDARRVFDRMQKRNVVTWNAMIGGLAQHGCGHEAYRLFLQMRREGFEPDAITYINILNASASAGALEWVKEVHGHARKAGLESDLRVGNSLVHMYSESGCIDYARRVFDRMEKRNVVSWNALIGGLAHHGYGHEALALFRKMNADHVKPDGTTFVAVLAACCHGGLLDDGRRLFSALTQDYGIQPDIFHYTCMVDLLGRAGHLEEAKRFITDMPVEPDVVIWTALLGACRTYGNVELGELAANALFKLEPSKASTYVLLSNIYAAAGKWEKVSLVRTMMQKRGVRKEAGRSWIDVDNKTHEFVVGDRSHPEAKAIYTELNKLTEKLKAEGYIPDTRLVLHDINEEDKELALCSHSEKLAIAYGLMHIPRGEPIRVRKNLRVCPDCHTATKFISKVTGRVIIARDANRFHHFKDGVCSCGDYW